MFIEGTKILMKRGVKKIEYLTLSDKVLCIDVYSGYDDEYDNIDNINVTSHNVQSIQTVEHDELYYINNDKLRVLESEYIFIKRNNKYLWKQVEKLLLGDYLIDYKKREIKITSIIPVKLKKKQTFFHVLVHEKGKHNKHYNTYFANGFLVHNAGSFAGGPCSSIPEWYDDAVPESDWTARYSEQLRWRSSETGTKQTTNPKTNKWKDFRTELTVRRYNWRPAGWDDGDIINDRGRYDVASQTYGYAGAWNTYFGTTPTRFLNWFSRFERSNRGNKNNLIHATPNGVRVFTNPTYADINENSNEDNVRLGMHSLDGLSSGDTPSNKYIKGSLGKSRYWSNDFVDNQDGNTTLKTYDLDTDHATHHTTRKVVNFAFESSITSNEYDNGNLDMGGTIPGNIAGKTGRIIIKYYAGSNYTSDIVLYQYYANMGWHDFCDQSTGNPISGAAYDDDPALSNADTLWQQASGYANTDSTARYGPSNDSNAWINISNKDTNGRWCKIPAYTNTSSGSTGGVASVNPKKTIYYEASGSEYSKVSFLRSGLINFVHDNIQVRFWHDGTNIGNLWIGVDFSSEFENFNVYEESKRYLGNIFDWEINDEGTRWSRHEDGYGRAPQYSPNPIISRSVAKSQMHDLQPCSECGAGLMNVIDIGTSNGSELLYGVQEPDDKQDLYYPYGSTDVERKQWYHLRTAYGCTFKAVDDIRLLAVGLKGRNCYASPSSSYTWNSNLCITFYVHSLYRPGTEENDYPQIDDWSNTASFSRRRLIGMGQIIIPSSTTNGTSYEKLWGWSNMDGSYQLSGSKWNGSNISGLTDDNNGNSAAYSYKSDYRPSTSEGYNNNQNGRLAMGRLGNHYNQWGGSITRFNSNKQWRAGSLASYVHFHPNGPKTYSRFSGSADASLHNGQGALSTGLIAENNTTLNWRGLYGDYPTWQYYMGKTGSDFERAFRSGHSTGTNTWIPYYANEWNNRGVILKKGGEYSILFAGSTVPAFGQELLPVEKKFTSGSQFVMAMDGNGNFTKELGDAATSGRIKMGQYILGGADKSLGAYDDKKPSHPTKIQEKCIAAEYKYRNSPWGNAGGPTTASGHGVSGYANIHRTEVKWRGGNPTNLAYLGGYNQRTLPNGEFTWSAAYSDLSTWTQNNYPGDRFYNRSPMIALQTQRIG